MKKLAIIALALVTLNGFAQRKDKKNRNEETHSELRQDISAKDIAELQSKKLTLKLDLTDAQQAKVQKIILKQTEENQKLREERKANNGEKKEKPSKDEMVEREIHRLDQKIEMKREMKTILSSEQYAKFEKMKPNHRNKKDEKKGKRSEKRNQQ
ncbi:Spy/CpxP family protein refolding chaperone [Winogradskyella wichelsiae]|uniref:Spy/CpxP family protein refolding chaperone n=1 Tax=Winogradskyella wichelsiae TaxID=2697007 RepID=UPI0015C868D6|nr:Spy/CpxP family protein refolding chaperone [Winogradskyella wichelsiae]